MSEKAVQTAQEAACSIAGVIREVGFGRSLLFAVVCILAVISPALLREIRQCGKSVYLLYITRKATSKDARDRQAFVQQSIDAANASRENASEIPE